MLGNGRLEAFCFDGVNRLCHIRGKLRKRVWIGVVLATTHALASACPTSRHSTPRANSAKSISRVGMPA